MDTIKEYCRYLILLCVMDYVCLASKYTEKLLVVSFDGFRWDYPQFASTPNFDFMKEHGTSVKYMNGVFPTKTFPSHVSLATGLHPESHGIVGNYMYDSHLQDTFNPRNHEALHWWSRTEPIWVTAKKHALKTGVYFWIGSTVKIQGILPDHYRVFNSSVPFKQRVDTVLRWFTEEDIDLGMLYLDEPDEAGHSTGTPNISNHTVEAIRDSDKIVGYLLKGLKHHNLHQAVNVLIVSDHGMTDVQIPEQLISLSDYINPQDIDILADDGALANILPKRGREHAVYTALHGKHANLSVYRRHEMPHRMHFRHHHHRIHPVLALPDEGWLVAWNASKWQHWQPRGSHGYDNRLLSMKPFFRAIGPNIRHGHTNHIFSQVDVYPLMCKILDIKPAPNNGSLDVIGQMLRPTAQQPIVTSYKSTAHVNRCGFMFLFLSLMSVLSGIRL